MQKQFKEKFTISELIDDLLNDPQSLVNHKLRRVWNTMNRRCYNPKDHSYHKYGAKGIEVCEEWRYSYYNFAKWAIYSGYIPRIGRASALTNTIDRIDPHKNYTPKNCRIISLGENSQLASKPNRVYIYDALDGKYLGSYRNSIEACRILKLNTSHVSECLHNEKEEIKDGRQVHGGYMFSYRKMDFKPLPEKVKITNRNIIIKNIKTKEEKVFKTNKEASEYINCPTTNLTKVLRGQRKTVKRYTAKYEPMKFLGEN